MNYVRDFLSHAAAVSQFADGGIKVGKCSGLVPGPRGRGGGGLLPCGMPPEFGGAPCIQPSRGI